MSAVTDTPVGSGVGQRVRVLVVEDSVDHQRLMVRRLEKAGMVVVAAGTAGDAMPFLEDVDIVLLDYKLPDRTGLEVLVDIAATPRAPSVVMVTALGSTDVAVDSMRAGAIDYVTKDHGYLDDLPDVVLRAWRQHDLTQRADELQRLALLVTSATGRDELFAEVARGARRLLRARSCALLLVDGGGLDVATVVGPRPDDLDVVVATGRQPTVGDDRPVVADDRLVVPLPRDGGAPLGLLVLWGIGDRAASEELDLARTFAAFAGIALRNLRQRELEQDLVFELQQTVNARRDFVSSVSHELRTPLTCIAGFTSTMQEHFADLSDESRLDMLGRIARNASDLQSLVDELIDLAALDRGDRFVVEQAELEAAAVVGQAVDDAAQVLGGRGVTVEVEAVSVAADETLVRRTVTNLLTNAAKFSPAASPIVVRGRRDGDQLLIEVQDEGIGLDPRAAAHVFEAFFRAESSVANAVRGSGIGLALVREYVRAMGGEVGVRSQPGAGSTFWFTLPTVDDVA